VIFESVKTKSKTERRSSVSFILRSFVSTERNDNTCGYCICSPSKSAHDMDATSLVGNMLEQVCHREVCICEG
jgi:hypothetical protein